MDSSHETVRTENGAVADLDKRPRPGESKHALVVASGEASPQVFAAASPAPSSDLVAGLSPLHSLRRRWPQMLCLGVLCAAVLATGAWLFFKPRFTAYASLRVHSQAPRLAFQIDEAEQASQFEVYKRTQRELVLGDEVLLAALRDSKVADVEEVKAVASVQDPVQWLRKQLRVDFPGDAEIMTISMIGDQPSLVANVVNAVLDAYVENVIDAGKQNRSDRLAELRKVLGVQEEKARRLRSKLENLTETLGSGDKDALSVKQQVAIGRFAQLQSELARVQFQRLGAELQLARLADQLNAKQKQLAARSSQAEAKQDDESTPSEAESEEPVPSEALAAASSLEVQRDKAVMAQREVVRQAELALSDVERRIGSDREEVLARYREQIERERERLAELEQLVRDELMLRHRESVAATEQVELQSLAEKHREADAQVQTLKVHEQLLSEELAKATQEADQIGTSSVNVELTRNELERLQKINDRISVEIETLTIELSSASRVEALGRAREPQAASAEERIKKTAAFGLLGFLAPCVALMWLDGLRRHVNDEADIQRHASLRLLGSVPYVPRPGLYRPRNERGRLALREAIDRIRTVLIREAELSDYRVIQITSAVGGEAKTTFAGQIARSLARAQRRTVLVDFDLRCPSVHEAFDMPLATGASELLRGEAQVAEVLRPAEQENMWLVLAGQCDRRALESLTNGRMDEIIASLRESFEFVVIDSSPVLPVVDALLVAQRADATILTAMRDVSRAPQLAEARERLREVGANVVGSVVTTTGYHSYYDTLARYAIR